ncbi:MAG: hypothetical protein HYW50_01940 [Candidatus Diapherotrites archaeon]|nr:hypothetical protein [Candidatus Diapherotrites archaeon]
MKISETGQTVLLDFMLAFFIFAIAFAFLAVFWSNGLEEKIQESRQNEMNLKASIAAEILVKSNGNPQNWEEIDISEAQFIGIASRENSVEEEKLNEFTNLDYGTAKTLLNIQEYDFFFELEGDGSASAGLAPTADIDTVTITRIVEYKGSEAVATLTVYQT